MHILHNLWRGNVTPCERHVQKGSDFAKLLHISAELEAAFCKALSKEQQATYEDLHSAQMQMMALAEEECFVEGFQIGARMILDVLTNYQPNLPEIEN